MKLILIIFSILSLCSFKLKYSTQSNIQNSEFKSMKIKDKTVYVTDGCINSCLAKKYFNFSSCPQKHSKAVRSLRSSGDFEIICLFKDGSAYLKN